MTPTNRLRFVERKINEPYEHYEHTTVTRIVKVLQQWWEPEQNILDMVVGKTQGEWRDVPLEKEE